MNIGDVVFVKQGKSKILGYGIVASDYYYDENREFYNSLRDVDWKIKGEWEHPGDAVLKTLTDITQYTDYVEKLKSLFTMNSEIQQYTKLLELKKNIILQGAPGTGKTYNTAALALSICGESVPESHDEVMQRYDELLKEGRIGFCTFHQSMDYEDFVEGIKPVTEGTSIKYEVKDGIFKKIADRARLNFEDSQKTPEQVKSDTRTREVFEGFCEEIQSQLNENDFVDLYSKSKMKIRNITLRSDGSPLSIQLSKTDGGPTQSLTWEIILRDYNNFKEGKIKSYEDVKPRYESKSVYHGNAMYYFELYKKMKDFEDKYAGNTNSSVVNLQNYVLIIDEINRGNVSRIFGELITLLEKDKRLGCEHPIKVTLPYSKESFGVPENLYIIGTMNTTDRSVGNIDYAVRRRFAFATLQSQRDLVVTHSTEKAAVLFDAVKLFIEKHKTEMDFEDLMVGHSYFFAKDDDELALRWQYEILPLLNEYIKDDILRADRLESNMSVDAFIESSNPTL
ncbi:MAG: AAA family ATPase [Paludibacteraceae bacterium]|nr:AAA family ATPase [Paludibacteraceae bacterium]